MYGEEKTLDIHGETVCPRGAAKEGGDHLSLGGEGGDSTRPLRSVLRGEAEGDSLPPEWKGTDRIER